MRKTPTMKTASQRLDLHRHFLVPLPGVKAGLETSRGLDPNSRWKIERDITLKPFPRFAPAA
jgi:hypothetical protein